MRTRHLWAAWILIGIVADAIAYIIGGKEHTLSIYVRRSLFLHSPSRWRRAGQVFFISFLGWLGIHIVADCLEPLPYFLSGDYRREQARNRTEYGTLSSVIVNAPSGGERAGDGSS